MSRELTLLLRLLESDRSVDPESRIRPQVEEDLDWDLFARLAVQHAVCPYVAERWRMAFGDSAPADRISLICREAAAVQRRSMMLLAALSKVRQAFEQARIPFLLIKGPITALAHYPSVEWRGFRDIDLLVRRQDVPASAHVLGQLAYRPQLPAPLIEHLSRAWTSLSARLLHFTIPEVEFAGRGEMAKVDLQWRVLADLLPAEDLFDHSHRIQIGGVAFATLTPSAHFVVTCAHAAKHRWSKLTWLVDIARMLGSPERCDWQTVVQTAEALKVSRMVRASVHVAHRVLKAELPAHPGLSAPLEPDVEAQAASDISDLLSTSPRYRGLCDNARRAWRLADTRSQALGAAVKQLVRPQLATFRLRLPASWVYVQYILSPAIVWAVLAVRALKRTVTVRG